MQTEDKIRYAKFAMVFTAVLVFAILAGLLGIRASNGYDSTSQGTTDTSGSSQDTSSDSAQYQASESTQGTASGASSATSPDTALQSTVPPLVIPTPWPTPAPPLFPAGLSLLAAENQAEIAPHLEAVIFNARFLFTPTYENSGQIVHPHVLFFEEKFMGFHYIMAMTPYPFSNNRYRNPSILGSQDGVIWQVPEGTVNPVVDIPVDGGGYYSEPFIFCSGDTLELWFRHTLAVGEDGQRLPRNSHNRVYRSISNDLQSWSDLEIMLDCPDAMDHFMSKVVMYNNGTYRLWYTNFSSRLYFIQSHDLENWSVPERVRADLGGLGIWHHDIVFTGEQYEALLTGVDWGNSPEFRLFHTVSYTGLDLGVGREIIIQDISPELEAMTVHKSTFVKIDGVYQMYFAVFGLNNAWRLFYFEIAEENLHMLFADTQ